MAALTLRATKGSPLTNAEVDANFTALNTDVGTRLLASAYTAADVLSKLLSVDGAGSGLDADMLDGHDSAYFTDIVSRLGFTPYNATNPAGYITAAASITGNAATATKLATARAINGVSFDGTAAITVADATKLPLGGGILSGLLRMTATDALRIVADNGYLSGWNAAESTRAGYLQFNVGTSVVLMQEGAGALTLGGNSTPTALVSSGALYPATDNARTLGTTGSRWSSVLAYAGDFASGLSAPILVINRSGGAARGISWYSSGYNAWIDYMSPSGASQGPLGTITAPAGSIVTSWARRSYIENSAGFGWTFESGANTTTPTVVAEIRSSDGRARFGGGIDTAGYVSASGPISAARIYAGWDSGNSGSISCSNWFRVTGNSGLYFSDYATGLVTAQGEYGSVGTYGATNAWAGFSISGGVVFMHNQSSTGSWGIFNDYTNTWMLQSDMGGNATFAGNVAGYSDLRIKKNITRIRDALKKLLTLTGIEFERTDTGELGIGLGAQDVQRVFPRAVHSTTRGADGKAGILAVAYGNLVGPIVEALREIDDRLTALEAA